MRMSTPSPRATPAMPAPPDVAPPAAGIIGDVAHALMRAFPLAPAPAVVLALVLTGLAAVALVGALVAFWPDTHSTTTKRSTEK